MKIALIFAIVASLTAAAPTQSATCCYKVFGLGLSAFCWSNSQCIDATSPVNAKDCMDVNATANCADVGK